jgi:hypothetical protein
VKAEVKMGDYWKFFVCVGLLCVICPSFLGFVMGAGLIIGGVAVVTKILDQFM